MINQPYCTFVTLNKYRLCITKSTAVFIILLNQCSSASTNITSTSELTELHPVDHGGVVPIAPPLTPDTVVEHPSDQPIRILSLDGGGTRGIIELYFLRELERHLHKPIGEMFHLVAGTSIGALIAAGLSKVDPITHKPEHTASELFDLMLESQQHMFVKKWSSLGGLCGERYCTEPIRKFIARMFGDSTFNSITIPCIAVAQDLRTLRAKIFKSYDTSETFRTDDVLLSTSAAPTYFKPHVMRPVSSLSASTLPYLLIDGGTIANNPSLIALNEARKLYPTASRFEIYSLGSGSYDTNASTAALAHGTGITTWAAKLPSIFIGGQVKLTDSLMETLIPDARFIRWNPKILSDRHIGLDDHAPETMQLLLHSADHMIRNSHGMFEEILMRLTAPMSALKPTLTTSSFRLEV